LRKDIKMKKLTAIFMSAVMCFLFAGCSNETAQSSEQQVSSDSVSSAVVEVPKPDGFKVDGTKLIDGYGEEFVMRGVNHAYTWFKSDTDTALEGIEYIGSNTVRLVLPTAISGIRSQEPSLRALSGNARRKTL
jgi:mannan endo-1,4-beta-mannosidase